MTHITQGVRTFDRFTLDLDRGCLLRGSKHVELRPKAFGVMTYLAARAGRLVPKQELLDAIWHNVAVTDDSLVHCIGELRRKLGDHDHSLIKTVPRRGYLLDALPLATTPSQGSKPMAGLSDRQFSLVVLPYLNVSGYPDRDQLAAAITDDLTNILSHLPVAVIAASTASTYKGREIDVRQIGRELGVFYVVEGTIGGSLDKHRVTTRLVDALTAKNVRIETIDTDRDELSTRSADVPARIASFLNIELMNAQAARSFKDHPNDPEAIDFVVRARALWARTPKGQDVSEPRNLFREAIQRDPSLVGAWIGLAMTYIRDVRFSPSRQQDLSDANDAAERAMALAPRSAWSHLVRGWVLYERKRIEQALVSFEHAAQLNEDLPFAHASIAAANIMLGRPERALDSMKKAMRLSPRDPDIANWQMFLGTAYLHLQRDKEAITWLNKSVALSPNDPFTRLFLTSALALSGREAEAKRELAELLQLKPEFTLEYFRSLEPSDEPTFRKQRERIYEGLCRAGLPA